MSDRDRRSDVSRPILDQTIASRVADSVGIIGYVAKKVWNSRARHGGGTGARASDAGIEDTTDHMQKSDMEGTRREHIAGNVETTQRVARRWVSTRSKKQD